MPALALATAITASSVMAAESADGFYRHTPGRPMISRIDTRPMTDSRFGQKYQGRWVGGWQAPGGWNAYRRPYRGFVLPSYWISPSFYIGNWSTYGFARPSAGYGWSRYYDDAVLTDRYGRVVDFVPNYNWDRYATRSRYAEDTGYDYAAYPDGYDDYDGRRWGRRWRRGWRDPRIGRGRARQSRCRRSDRRRAWRTCRTCSSGLVEGAPPLSRACLSRRTAPRTRDRLWL
jgi:Ni/Co efflux regulator RcnB